MQKFFVTEFGQPGAAIFFFSWESSARTASDMTIRVLLILALVFMVAGCDNPSTKKKKPTTPPPDQMKDQSGDVAFQSFVARLNKAVAMHDLQTLASLMTANFGYRLEPAGEGDGVYQYWDENNVWPDLQAVLSQKFTPKGRFMVCPPAFRTDPQYTGWRAGMTLVNGSWKFAYFVKD